MEFSQWPNYSTFSPSAEQGSIIPETNNADPNKADSSNESINENGEGLWDNTLAALEAALDSNSGYNNNQRQIDGPTSSFALFDAHDERHPDVQIAFNRVAVPDQNNGLRGSIALTQGTPSGGIDALLYSLVETPTGLEVSRETRSYNDHIAPEQIFDPTSDPSYVSGYDLPSLTNDEIMSVVDYVSSFNTGNVNDFDFGGSEAHAGDMSLDFAAIGQ